MLIQASRAAASRPAAAETEAARPKTAPSAMPTRLSQAENRADAPASSRAAPRANPLDGLCAPQTLESLKPEPARQRLKDSALLANFPYSRDLDSLRATQWSPDAELARLLAKGSKLEFQPQQARLMDPESGLVAYVFRNKAAGEIRLVFGGTTSGRGVGGLAQRNLKNLVSVARQWRANIGNAAFGGRPACYAQAAQLTAKLQGLAAGLPLMRGGEPDYTVSTGGHSLGGGMAAYAAMKLSTPQRPVHAECFSSAQFGRGLQRELLARHDNNLDQARAASAHIRHYCVQGDLVPALDGLLPVRHVGQLYLLPANRQADDSRLGRHDKFLDHVQDFVAGDWQGQSRFYA
ncbi:hypothetical protein HNO92_001618 [Chromobacterium alkanivorans]|uniref:lipase family protein n=1 Tax=Chromobacterium alkanivorans TaxID=1071719 RepID=UPI002166C16C|nr:hypothetical protein [Chromobacterium alkanivorans]MCS3804482.1 hypothetical protein [Chromobacterium alkanivorans]MCS3818821.1 hypothetical protein [Chromobacterium alkanivorans]MCS3873321.1 hypothetical protein [Chromobacterium alkanivorans]